MVFGIRGNIYKPELPKVVLELVRKLKAKKTEFLVEDSLAKLIAKKSKKVISASETATPKQLVAKSDFIISIGGDGTFLATAKLVHNKNIPIIGVNMGRLGYLAETSIKETAGFVNDIKNGRFKIEERSVLQAECNSAKGTIYGINEIVIGQNGIVKTIFIEIFYNDSLVISYLADGLIVSTPTGSTGYSLSAGGPIVNPETKVLIICPICPHTFTARPIILPDEGIVRVNTEHKQSITVSADGNSSFKPKKNSPILIRKAAYNIKVVKSLQSNYFNLLNQKLLWGADKRNIR